MPALHIFGRRWCLGSDDLVTPTSSEILIRSLWLIVLVVVYVLDVKHDKCSDADKLGICFTGSMVLQAVYLVLNTALAVSSAQGYIMEPSARRHVTTLLYIKLVIFILEAVWTSLATAWIYTLSKGCSSIGALTAKAVIISEWILIACGLIAIYLMYDPLGKRPLKKRSLKDYKKMWYRRCRLMCCCLGRDDNRTDAFEETATMFTLFFHGRDFVITDILAGVILLNAKQKYERRMNSRRVLEINEAATLPVRGCYKSDYKDDDVTGEEATKDLSFKEYCQDGRLVNNGKESTSVVSDTEKTKLFDASDKRLPDYGSASGEDRNAAALRRPTARKLTKGTEKTSPSTSHEGSLYQRSVPASCPKHWMTVENAAYYLRYATAIYGYSNYSGCYNCRDRIPLYRKFRWFKNDPHLSREILKGDNYWECELSGILLYSHLDREDIVYADLDCQIFTTPFVVARDDRKNTVVVAIRGTMSPADALTDLTALGEDTMIEHLPRGNVHRGIMKVAKKIKHQLEDVIHLENKIPKGYNLVVTGHSLGGGVAAVLSLILRDQYPDVKCFAFSPPGGLVSLPLSIYQQEFVLTCVLGMDLVARLSLVNMEKFKTELLAVIKNSRLPKYKILSSGLFLYCCCTETSDDLLIDDVQTAVDQSPSMAAAEHNVVEMDESPLVTGEQQMDTDTSSTHSSLSAVSSQYAEVGESEGDSRQIDPEHKRTYLDSCKADNAGYSPGARDTTGSRTSSKASSRSRKSKHSSPERKITQSQRQPMSASHAKWRKKQKNRKVGLAASEPLYLPGCILYLYEDETFTTKRCWADVPVYDVRWASVEEFNSIELHPKMMQHHNPYTIAEALEQILTEQHYCATIVHSDKSGFAEQADSSCQNGCFCHRIMDCGFTSSREDDEQNIIGVGQDGCTMMSTQRGANRKLDSQTDSGQSSAPELSKTVLWRETEPDIETESFQTVDSVDLNTDLEYSGKHDESGRLDTVVDFGDDDLDNTESCPDVTLDLNQTNTDKFTNNTAVKSDDCQFGLFGERSIVSDNVRRLSGSEE